MAGSNDYVFKIGAVGAEAVIAGQLEGSMTLNGAPVEITNKASGGYIEYLPDFVAGKQVSFAVTFTATDDVAQNTVKAAIEAGTQVAGNIITGIGAEEWQCDTWVITGRSDTAAVNGVAQMACTISTSGIYAYTPSA